MSKNNLIDFLIILLLHIAISCIPFSLFIINCEWLILLLEILCQVLLIIFKYWFLNKKTNLNYQNGKLNKRYFLILLPTILVCFSNYFYLPFAGNITTNFSYLTILNIFLAIFVGINEEIIFRLILINNLNFKNKWMKVIVSALIFSLCHLTAFISSLDVSTLIMVPYTFALGLLSGTIYVLVDSIIPSILLHILFNIFNDVIFSLFSFSNFNFGSWVIVNIVVSLVVCIYIAVVLLVKFYKSKNKLI